MLEIIKKIDFILRCILCFFATFLVIPFFYPISSKKEKKVFIKLMIVGMIWWIISILIFGEVLFSTQLGYIIGVYVLMRITIYLINKTYSFIKIQLYIRKK